MYHITNIYYHNRGPIVLCTTEFVSDKTNEFEQRGISCEITTTYDLCWDEREALIESRTLNLKVELKKQH